MLKNEKVTKRSLGYISIFRVIHTDKNYIFSEHNNKN
nr:MAG TPA: hypothetical protein [Caudoviricetes sp.]